MRIRLGRYLAQPPHSAADHFPAGRCADGGEAGRTVVGRLSARAQARLLAMSVASCVLASVWFVIALFVPAGSPVVGWIPGMVAAVAAVVACWTLARHAESQPALARFWRQIGIGTALVGAGTLLRALHSLDPVADIRQLPAPAMALYLAAILVNGWALFRLPLGMSTARERATFALDTATVMVSAGLCFWLFTIRAVLAQDRGNSQEILASLTASALTLVLVFAVVKVVMTGAATIDAGALRLLGVALAVGAVGTAPEPLLAAHGPSTGQVVVPLACTLAVLAASRQRRAIVSSTAPTSTRRRPFSVLPYTAIVASGALLIYTASSAGRADRVIVAGAVLCLVGLVVARQILAFTDNQRLLRQLKAGMEQLRARERRFRSLVQHSSDFITVTGPDGRFTYVSPGARRVLGIEPTDWVGRRAAELVHPDDLPVAQERFADIKDTPAAATVYHTRLAHRDGSWRWIEVSTANLFHDPAIAGIVGNARDITEERAFRQRLHHQAYTDQLTQLGNRAQFHERVDAAITQPDIGPVTVLLVDLNDFKTVNDTLGHAAGDSLLMVVAQRLSALVGSDDLVARLGGDEFAVLVSDPAGDGVTTEADTAATLADNIALALAEPIAVAGYRTSISASIGVAHAQTGTTAAELLRRADIAMYAAKADRDGADTRYARYTPALERPILDRAALEAELRTASESGQLTLMYQPIVAVSSSRVVGVEALLRWAHPHRGPLSPAEFIPLAERSDLILSIGRWVLTNACEQARRWYAEYGDAAPAISVNVSARQLHDPTLVDHVRSVLAGTNLPAHRLTVEITETAAVHRQSVAVLRALTGLGVRVSLDDFGTGQSSLSLLQDCPVDEIKLDRSFSRTATTAGQRSVAVAVIQLAHALGLDAVAEGVETRQQAACLARLGYRHLQGYHYARPSTPEQIDQLIAGQDNRTNGEQSRAGHAAA
jgi:diguanylate cyclase (GGDEF)-like protein/PAS domain S-box-containing protein